MGKSYERFQERIQATFYPQINTHKDEDEQGIPENIAFFTKSVHRISQEKRKPHINTNVNENRTRAAETQGV